MEQSKRPLINHVSDFLVYCSKKGLSENTLRNYKRYLSKFQKWMADSKYDNLSPNELTVSHAKAYIAHINSSQLKTISQNYYLIALRALLSYFEEIDISSLKPAKISLNNNYKAPKPSKIISLGEIKRLLDAPNVTSPSGLRDKAILTILVNTGLKLNQLTALNREHIDILLPPEAVFIVNQYLKIRRDTDQALFINYRGRKNSAKRLTPRSIERSVLRYAQLCGIDNITPESLRWAKMQAVFDHFDQNINFRQNLSWNQIENRIAKIEKWLRNNIAIMNDEYKKGGRNIFSNDIIFRKLAILVASEKVILKEIRGTDWFPTTKDNIIDDQLSHHGSQWHKKLMDKTAQNFRKNGIKIIQEPNLNYGKADLAVFPPGKRPFYIEIGTVSLFKLWYNLCTMKDIIYVLPSDNKIIEFKPQ